MGVRTIDGTCESALERKGAAMTLLPTLNTSVRLPTGELDENRAIDCAASWISMVRHRMDKEYSREWLETELRKGLREGRLPLTIYAVQAADAGDEIADAALRRVYADMAGGTLVQRGPGHLQVWAYGQRAVLRAPHKRPQGHRWHDDWMRNIQICRLIDLACHEFGVRATRSRAARRADRTPSGISIVVDALARNCKIHLNESSVQQNIWFGLPGELVRATVPRAPSRPEITHVCNDLAVS
jgi:hypothetical protein